MFSASHRVDAKIRLDDCALYRSLTVMRHPVEVV